jgi:hypothetical protein
MKRRFGVNAAGYYVGPLKKIHRPKGRESLAVRCLRDGTLDVCLRSGRVYSFALGKRKRIKTRIDEDGYEKFTLKRDVSWREKRRADRNGRRRLSMEVFVHRLVMMKKLAVAKGEARWREHLEDLPGDRDVHHVDGKTNNVARMLTLEFVSWNRGKADQREEEPIPF